MRKRTSARRQARERRHRRIRGKIYGTLERPRLVVFKSQKHIYAQLLDDQSQKVLAQSSSLGLKPKGTKGKKMKKRNNVDIATLVGEDLAKKALTKKIGKVVFDSAGYKYHGRVKALAESTRKGGVQF